MSIFLDNAGASGTAFFNLETISGESGAVSMEDVPGDPSVFQIAYTSIPGQPATADRLSQLVNNDFGAPVTTTSDIVVTALNGGIDPYSLEDITGNGISYLDESVDPPVIRNVYDVSQCCGAGLALFDVDGNAITTPNPVILYHELSHAFREATGTQAANDEVPATTDENVMRTQLGLCLRDVNNHGGECAGGSDCGGSAGNENGGPPEGGCAAGPSGGGGCFIVSATTGSSSSPEVHELRRLRDRAAQASGLAAQLIDAVYRDYYQFSPAIATELYQDVVARQLVLVIVVRPLIAWYKLAGALALGSGAEQQRSRQAAQMLLNECAAHPLRALITPLVETLRSGSELTPGAPQLLAEFAEQLRGAAGLRYASWAILDPFARMWAPTSRQLDLDGEVAEWLAEAPLETLPRHGDATVESEQLRGIAGFFEFQPAARRCIGQRLARAWPDRLATLEQHDFIAQRGG